MKINVTEEVPVKIRDAMVPSPGYVWVSCDYSQLEYRTMTNLAEDEHLVKMFEDGVDFHTATASMMLGIPVDQVDKKSRKIGKCVTGDTYIASPSHGLIQIKDISGFRKEDEFTDLKDFKVINADGKVVNAASFYYGGKRKVTNIITRYGFKLGGSSDKHRIIVVGPDGNLVYKKMSDITMDDYVVLYLGGFEKETDAYVKFSNASELKAREECSTHRNDYPCSFVLEEVTEDVAELWGMLLSDGYFHKNGDVASFGSADRENIDRFIYLTKKLYPGFEPAVSLNPTKNGVDFWNVRINSVFVVAQFSHNKPGRKGFELQFPLEILRSKTSVKAAFLAGWFNGDGCFMKKGVNTASISKDFICGMQQLLMSMGILSDVSSETPTTIRGMDYLVWKLMLSDVESFHRFYNLTYNYLIQRKKDKFDECIDRVDSHPQNFQAAYNLHECLKQAFKGLTCKQRKNTYRHTSKGVNSYGYADIKEYYLSETTSVEAKDLLKRYLDRQILAVPVKEIYETEEEVFDLFVPDGNSFVGSFYMCHNTLNFGISFGMTVNGLAQRLGCTKQEAQEKQDLYFKNIPKIRDLINKTKATTKARGYSRTFFGRMRPFKKQLENAAGNWYKEDNALMTSFNTTVQGCIPGESLVYTEKGVLPIKDLIGEEFSVWNGNRFVNATAFPSGAKNLCRTTFDGGHEFYSSESHYFLTCQENDPEYLKWKSAKDLVPGDIVAVNLKPVDCGIDFPEDLAELLGRYCGDGDWGNGSPFIWFHYEKELDDLDYYKSIAEKYGFSPMVKIKKRKPGDVRNDIPRLILHAPFQNLLRELDLKFDVWDERKISLSVFSWCLAARRAFVKGLMSADGGFSSYRDSKANNEIKFTKANPGVINSLKELLFTCGIYPCLQFIENGKRGAYRLHVAPIHRYMSEIGFRQEYKNSVNVKTQSFPVPKPILMPIREEIYSRYKGSLNKLLTHSEGVMLSRCAIGMDSLRNVLEKLDMLSSEMSDLLEYKWVKFEHFEKLEKSVPMFDITTAEAPYSYVTQGFITHNSGADFAKIALGRAYKALLPYGSKVRMLTQVHDEINYEVQCVREDGTIDSDFLAEVLKVIDYAMSFRKVYPGWADIPADIEIGWNYGSLKGPEEIKKEFGVDVLAIQASQPPTDLPKFLFENLNYDVINKSDLKAAEKALKQNTKKGDSKGSGGSKTGEKSKGGENTNNENQGPSKGQEMAKKVEQRMRSGGKIDGRLDLTGAQFRTSTVLIHLKDGVNDSLAFDCLKKHVKDHFGNYDVVLEHQGILYRFHDDFRVNDSVADLEEFFDVDVFEVRPVVKLDLG